MKTRYLIALFLICSCQVTAQKNSAKETADSDKKLLPPEHFDKMIIQDITYAIFGENAPVSGIKIDISKPEATLSGTFLQKKMPSVLLGFDFKGGITDKNFSIYKGQNSFNTVFEFKPSIHYIPPWNKAKYYIKDKPIIVAQNELVKIETEKVLDSFYVVALMYNKHLTQFDKLQDDSEGLPTTSLTAPQRNLLIYFIKKTLPKKDLSFGNNVTLDAILGSVPEADPNDMVNTYNDNVWKAYKKYKKLFDKREADESAKMIANASEAWTRKKYSWFTLSPSAKTEKNIRIPYEI